MLRINEIYLSLQGESTFAGLPCIFVRLTGCNLRCSFCDSVYAFFEGESISTQEVVRRVQELAKNYTRSSGSEGLFLPLVELTGGEPLLQKGSLDLMSRLADAGFTVLLETSGAWDIRDVDSRVRRIMDLKCPSSGEHEKNLYTNLDHIRSSDEIKFVISSLEDYEWAKKSVEVHGLSGKCPLLFSWAAPLAEHQKHPSLKQIPTNHRLLTRLELVEAIIRDKLPVRFQLQMHKMIWAPDLRGV